MRNRVLVYGYGNPGRQDDGLGPALAALIERERLAGVVTDSNYQLQVEDALAVSESDTVIFVDAAVSGEEPFSFTELEPANEITFTTHSVSPASVLALCHEMYGIAARAYVLAIRGYGWEFMEKLTPVAEKNLEQAYQFLKDKISDIISASDTMTLN
ncbi:MAG: hydrogenase maturation protease [Spirochaetes bacterium]|nr:hydrogenase maturation protease [Spirochaetota bacterium]